MPDARKKPCRICRRWFRPDNRVGDRQHACGSPDCQQARRQQTQASWRARNRGYATAHRISQRNLDEDAEPVRTPPPLNRLPWDLAKDQFGGQGADFIGVMGTLLVRVAKDQFRTYLADSKRLSGTLPPTPEKTSWGAPHTETRDAPDAATGVSSTGPPPGTASGSPPGAPSAVAGLGGRTRSTNAHRRHRTRRPLPSHRRPPAYRRAAANGPRHRRRRGVADERSRSVAAGTFAAHPRAGQCARTRLAAGGDGEPDGLFDRRVGAPLRSQQAVGGQPSGAGGNLAGGGAATGARRQDRGVGRHPLPGSGGRRQRRALPADGRSVRRPRMDDAAGRRVLSSLAPGQRRGPRAPAGRPEVIRQNATATIAPAGQTTQPDRRPRATGPGAGGVISAVPPRRGAAQDRARHRRADPNTPTHRGAETRLC